MQDPVVASTSVPPSALTPDYLILGHVTLDVLDRRVSLGGTATYAALTARNLGLKAGVVTSAGWQPGLVDILQNVYVARLPAPHTTCFLNLYSAGRRRQRVLDLAQPLEYRHVLPEWRSAPVVHVAPVVREVSPSILNSIPKNALVGVTPQGWMRRWDEEGNVYSAPLEDAEVVLSRADVVVMSEEDIPDHALLAEYARRARLLVVTQGERGATIYHQGEARRSPAFRARREVDPTGAGDAFAAAYLVEYYRTRDPFASADFANCVASFVVEKTGPGAVPSREQVEERWRKGSRLP